MRLILTSDLHGHLPTIPPCDVLLIAGDLCPIENHDLDFQAEWLKSTFCDWLRDVPARKKIFIAGNHDFVFAQLPGALSDIAWPGTYLEDSAVEWEGVHFWGSPWANELVGWPFTATEEDLERHWQRIPEETEVLLIHGPAYGYGDVVRGRYSGDPLHVGSRTLVEAVNRLPRLRLLVCGHIHEGAGVYQHGQITLVNAALMDQDYDPVQPLRPFDLP